MNQRDVKRASNMTKKQFARNRKGTGKEKEKKTFKLTEKYLERNRNIDQEPIL